MLGLLDGASVGGNEGVPEGWRVGISDGNLVGGKVGITVGRLVGHVLDGADVGGYVGWDGANVGLPDVVGMADV